MTEKQTLGSLARDAVRLPDLPRPAEVVEGYKALVDLTGAISDAMEGGRRGSHATQIQVVGVTCRCA